MTTLERLENAVRILASGHEALVVRLVTAYRQQLRHVRPGDMPAELVSQLNAIHARFGHGGIEDHLQGMTPKAASRLALDIFELSCALSQGLYH
ncbi:hypothetical protein [Aquabacterium sp.]|uniref:hypothetical protein n=1 Tax=Aquabacterium sp. TaxID=1872578 RepID=UPI0025BEC21A|nr:hypothetical protein [Aquabacterium sp.]